MGQENERISHTHIIHKAKVPVFAWCDAEKSALDQARNAASLPCAFHHVALMPDCHPGYGVSIGSVLALKGAICPNAVGVDISCGMHFVQTDIPVAELVTVKTSKGNLIRAILDNIKRNIPTGFEHHREKQDSFLWDKAPDIEIVQQQLESAKYQLGTLGGGNHFLELQRNEDGFLALMLHSGSRNFGKKIAEVYNKRAIQELSVFSNSWAEETIKNELAFLSVDSRSGQEYIAAMQYAMLFARENRRKMMDTMLFITCNMINKYALSKKFETSMKCDVNHNYAVEEEHFGKKVWVHRKGAIRANKDDIGIIPGSMGTSSYIVRGLGNPDSFNSPSHGAGRIMGRNDVCRKFTIEQAHEAMKGIEFLGFSSPKHRKKITTPDISEAPFAYKNIDEVMHNQEDLVKIVSKLTPIGVVKE